MRERQAGLGILSALCAALVVAVSGGRLIAAQASVPADPPEYRAVEVVLIPAGSFQMGDAFNEDSTDERPVRTVMVSAFAMDKYEVTKALWDEVASWAGAHGYDIGPEARRVRGQAIRRPTFRGTRR